MKSKKHKQFVPRTFFRSLPNPIIKDLFTYAKLCDQSFWDTVKDKKNNKEDIYNHFNQFKDKERDLLEEILSRVNDLCNDYGMEYLQEACKKYSIKIDYKNATAYDISAYLFLGHSEAFEYPRRDSNPRHST